MSSLSAPSPTDEHAAAYAWCRDVARTRARNFYYGLCLTPEPRRSAVYAVYAWMRIGDDLVDDAGDDDAKREALAAFRAATANVLDGMSAEEQPIGAPEMWAAFADTVRAFGVEARDIDAMLAGLGEDLDHAGYDTLDDLQRYCARVASSVGRVCVTIWGLRDGMSMEDAVRLADRRGVAFQLTNILRDFAEDFDDGRVYLPRESLERAGITPGQLRRWDEPAACERLVNEVAAAARSDFEASAPLEAMIDPACAPTLWAMTRIYAGLLEKIEDRPARIVGEARIRLQSLHKAGIAVRALARSKRGRW